jgi:hypothetical protein
MSQLLEDVSFKKLGCLYYQHDVETPHFSCAVRNLFTDCFPGHWIRSVGPDNWSARPQDFKPIGLLSMGMDE